MTQASEKSRPVCIGSSACLLGQPVRYDGGHQRIALLADRLAGELEIIPVCPEMDIGLGSPREPMNLYGDKGGGEISLRTVNTGSDLTGVMTEYARLRVSELKGDHLRGFVLKSRSPSCGMKKVPIHDSRETPDEGAGLFAAELMARFPSLPVIEEYDLLGFPTLYQFLVRVYAYDRWRQLAAGGMKVRELKRFHLEHRLLVEASKPGSWGDLGDLTGGDGGDLSPEVIEEYERRLMIILARIPSHESHAEALFKMAFSIEKGASEQVMERVITVVDDYRSNRQSLVKAKEIVRDLWIKRKEEVPEAAAYLNAIPRPLAEAIVRPATPE